MKNRSCFMIKNVLDYLEYNAIKLPNHIAFKEVPPYALSHF